MPINSRTRRQTAEIEMKNSVNVIHLTKTNGGIINNKYGANAHACNRFVGPQNNFRATSFSDTEPIGLSRPFNCMRVCVLCYMTRQPKKVFLQQSEDISGTSGHLPGPHNSPQWHLVFRLKVGLGHWALVPWWWMLAPPTITSSLVGQECFEENKMTPSADTYGSLKFIAVCS